MKTFSNLIAELLRNYEQYYHFSLRLKNHHQSFYIGFTDESKSQIALSSASDAVLECSESDAESKLRSIEIALLPYLNHSSEQCFASMLDGSASAFEIEELRNEVGENQLILVLIAGMKEKDSVKEIAAHLLKDEALICIQNDYLWILMKHQTSDELRKSLESIQSTIETELYEKVYLFVSSAMDDVKNLKTYVDEVLEIKRLIQKYDPSYLVAWPNDVWMLKMLDSLSDKDKEHLKGLLCQKEFHKLDDELVLTAVSFMKNNLSISSTARNLYIHRNTLIYRLDKIYQLTGFDLRTFEDAQKFYFALKLKK